MEAVKSTTPTQGTFKTPYELSESDLQKLKEEFEKMGIPIKKGFYVLGKNKKVIFKK